MHLMTSQIIIKRGVYFWICYGKAVTGTIPSWDEVLLESDESLASAVRKPSLAQGLLLIKSQNSLISDRHSVCINWGVWDNYKQKVPISIQSSSVFHPGDRREWNLNRIKTGFLWQCCFHHQQVLKRNHVRISIEIIENVGRSIHLIAFERHWVINALRQQLKWFYLWGQVIIELAAIRVWMFSRN